MIETFNDLEPLLRNYSNYYRDRYRQGKTGSLEGNYKSTETFDEQVTVPSNVINLEDARVIEEILTQHMELRAALIVVVQYCYRQVFRNNLFYGFCRKWSIKPESNKGFNAELNKSKRLIIDVYNKHHLQIRQDLKEIDKGKFKRKPKQLVFNG